jgi:hypothetical protein
MYDCYKAIHNLKVRAEHETEENARYKHVAWIRIALMWIRILRFDCIADLDLTTRFNADPDPAPHQSDPNLQPQVYKHSKAPF